MIQHCVHGRTLHLVGPEQLAPESTCQQGQGSLSNMWHAHQLAVVCGQHTQGLGWEREEAGLVFWEVELHWFTMTLE